MALVQLGVIIIIIVVDLIQNVFSASSTASAGVSTSLPHPVQRACLILQRFIHCFAVSKQSIFHENIGSWHLLECQWPS